MTWHREHLSALRTSLPGIDVRVFRARHSFVHLRETVDRIGKDMPALASEGIRVWDVGVRTISNAVRVGLARLDPAWIEELRRRYGRDVLEFEEAEPMYPVSTEPPR